MTESSTATRKRMKIYRFADGAPLTREKMPMIGFDESVMAGLSRLAKVGNTEELGTKVIVLFEDEATGTSLTYAWFKSGYILPRHSHDADCLYYVIAGSLTMGTQKLGQGDGVLIPADFVYSYEVGPEGVEVLEFRTATHFHFKFQGNDEAHWDRMIAANERGKHIWASETAPTITKRQSSRAE
ncbi:cupin domain-containing protein [Sphingobium sp. AS12]|uniref:cupin domain-containing protein n=1 Tax=Sphingobium sp. AS12 TaxID=2849495 RepID=UPI001C31881B|nr:cupin domain-containing protein [Sphingobium sp. AS12]MBV2148104.1 cupin domain-containing protein [Sphingobium sp. AS12]